MFCNLKRFKAYFVFIFAASLLSFNGSLNSETGINLSEPAMTPVIDSAFILPANPGPTNNGGSAGWAIFFDLIAGPRNVFVTHMRTGSTATPSQSFSVIVFTRSGTALGGPVGSGPGSSTAGWTLLDTVPVVQGPTSGGISEIFALPTILVHSGDTIGVAVRFIGAGPRYFGSGGGPYSEYLDTNLKLVSGDGRSAPFTPTGSFFAPRVLTGEIHYYVSPLTAIGNISAGIPDGFNLAQNYPNPFNPTTVISFQLPVAGQVSLKIYDALGREVSELVNEQLRPGTYSVNWSAAQYTSGVYFYKLTTDNYTQTKRMCLVK